MHVNDHKIQDMGVRKVFISFYVVNQYHTKRSHFSFSTPKISMIKM